VNRTLDQIDQARQRPAKGTKVRRKMRATFGSLRSIFAISESNYAFSNADGAGVGIEGFTGNISQCIIEIYERMFERHCPAGN